MRNEEVDPRLEVTRRSGASTVLIVGTGIGAVMAILFVITLTGVIDGGGAWSAAYVPMLASFGGTCGAVYLLCYRRAYQILTTPHTKHVPTKGRISVLGLVMLGLAIAVVIFTLVYYYPY